MKYAIFIVLAGSLFQATLSTLFSLACALPFTHFCARFSFPGKRVVLASLMMLCVMSTKLTAYAVELWYSLHGFVGIVVGHVLLNMPFACCLLYIAYQKLDYTAELVAQDLGATSWQRYRTVVLPLLRPTIISTAAVTFLYCFSSYSIPNILGTAPYHVTPEIMVCRLYGSKNFMQSLVYGLLRLGIIAGLYCATAHTTGYHVVSPHLDQLVPLPQYRVGRYGVGWLLFVVSVVLFLISPFVALFACVLDQNVLNFLKNIFVVDFRLGFSAYQVVINSVWLALVSSFFALFVGFIISKLVVIIRSPWVVRVLVAATGITFILGSVGSGILFSLLATWLPFKWGLLVLCHMLLHVPIVYRMLHVHMMRYQQEWSVTAQSYGASTAHLFFSIELPFMKKALLKSFCLVFGFSLSEVGASAVLGDSIGMTMPVAKSVYRTIGYQEGALGLSVILLLLVFCVTYAVQFFDE